MLDLYTRDVLPMIWRILLRESFEQIQSSKRKFDLLLSPNIGDKDLLNFHRKYTKEYVAYRDAESVREISEEIPFFDINCYKDLLLSTFSQENINWEISSIVWVFHKVYPILLRSIISIAWEITEVQRKDLVTLINAYKQFEKRYLFI